MVSEESHVEAMRAAIRGDFERLERRRGTLVLMRRPDPRPEAPAEADEEPGPGAPPRRSLLARLLER